MSERESLAPGLQPARVGHRFLTIACLGCLLLTWGCKRAATPSQSEAQAVAIAHSEPAARQSPEPPEQAPLLLEDEPAGAASTTPAADNSRCFVCHANYMEEKLAVTHAKANVSCATCHGPSDTHIADESWASGGNGTAPDIMYPKAKINPACLQCHPKEKIDTPQHVAVLADTEGKSVCTDCHGTHRLPQRRCKWK
jgi:hypothetical protein